MLGYWLLAENHGIFGDEGWHLMFLIDAWQKPAASTLHRLWNLYVFNDQYPPVFYLPSVPFFFLFDNHLVGARLYSATLAAIAIAIFYRILRLHVGRWLAVLGVVLLFSSGVFIEATRYYLLEIGLLVWLLAFYLLVANYLRAASTAKAAGIGAILVAGLLTKPNFAIYAFPIGLLLLYGIVVRVRSAQMGKAQTARHVALMSVPALVLALPWYIVNLLNPTNLLLTLRRVRPSGELVPVYDPVEMARFTWASLPEFFPSFFYAALVVCALLVGVARHFRPEPASADPAARARGRATAFFLGYVAYLTIVLFPLGLYYALRWNLSYAFLVAAMVCLLASLPARPLRIAFCVTLAALSLTYTFNNFFRQFTASPLFTWGRVAYWNPSALPTGAKEIARIIDREERQSRAPGSGADVAILAQVHGGLHAGAANYYLRTLGSPLKSTSIGFFDNPVDVDFLTGSRYIVVPSVAASPHAPPVTYRYQAVAQRWLPRHPELFHPIGRVASRYGELDVYKRTTAAVPVGAEDDLIRIGTELERGTAFEPFWKLARFRLGASSGRLTPALAQELDAVSSQVSSLQGRLDPPILERLKYQVLQAQQLERAIAGLKEAPLTEAVVSTGADGFVEDVRRASQCMLVRGWIVPSDHAGPMKAILVVHDGMVLAELEGLNERPDIAKHFGNPALGRSGFLLCIPLERLRDGGAEFELVGRAADGTLHVLAKRRIPRD